MHVLYWVCNAASINTSRFVILTVISDCNSIKLWCVLVLEMGVFFLCAVLNSPHNCQPCMKNITKLIQYIFFCNNTHVYCLHHKVLRVDLSWNLNPCLAAFNSEKLKLQHPQEMFWFSYYGWKICSTSTRTLLQTDWIIFLTAECTAIPQLSPVAADMNISRFHFQERLLS